jgi:hypothetical protein
MFIPYENGMCGAPAPTTPGSTPALAAECRNAAVLTNLSDTRRVFAGTQTKMYELTGGAWSDISRAGNYAGGTETRWSFAQFGNSALCSNKVEAINRSTGAAFADIATAPKAKIIFSVGAFVMALNVDDGTDKPDGWHCCAAFDETDWTAAVSTQATKGRLVSTPGAIVSGGRMGEYAIAYKERAIYVGQYVGAPAVWDWVQVPGGDAGCIGQDAWCDVNGAHFIVGQDNFWSFDGTRPQPVGDNQIRQWFFNNSDSTYRYKTKCIYDRQNNRVWVFFAGIGSTTCDKCIVYHVVTKQWGKADQSIEAVLNYVASGVTIDGLASISSTIDGLPDIPFDSQYWQAGGRALSTFNTSHQLQLQTGTSASSGFTTGDTGDDEGVSTVQGARLRYAAGYAPVSATATGYYKMNEGDSLTTGNSGAMANGKFDMRQTGRFHRQSFSFTGDVRVTGISLRVVPTGAR